MDVIIICACIPTLLPLVQQLTGQRDYYSTRHGSKRSLWNNIAMRPVKSQGAIDSVAFHAENRQESLPEGEIRTTTELQTQWEAV